MTGNQTGEGLGALAVTRPSLTCEAVCSQLADRFQVRLTEVGLLRLEASTLRFIFPRELAHVGSIPLNSTAMAARTARSQRAGLFNNYVRVPHWNVFETIRLHAAGKDAPMVIQKLMSAPIVAKDGSVVGVIQISRKGATPHAAGPDFGPDDLQELKMAAAEIAPIMSLLSMPERTLGQRLSFCNHPAEQTRL